MLYTRCRRVSDGVCAAVQLSWRRPAELAAGPKQDAACGPRSLQCASAAVREGTPVLTLAHAASSPGTGYMELRSAVVDLVDVATGGDADRAPLRLLTLHDVQTLPVAGASPAIDRLVVRVLASHPCQINSDDCTRAERRDQPVCMPTCSYAR
jgi:hypothetical protein